MDNTAIAGRLAEWARGLEQRGANLYRVRAYRRAAEVVMGLETPIAEIVAGGDGSRLQDLPGIGASLSRKIAALVRTGEIASLKEGKGDPGGG